MSETRNPYVADSIDAALAQAQYDGYLPRCVHDGCLIDWSGELLEPPCGCRLSPRSLDDTTLRRMPDSSFVEEWTKPAAQQRYTFNDLLAEAMRRGYDTDGRQVLPARFIERKGMMMTADDKQVRQEIREAGATQPAPDADEWRVVPEPVAPVLAAIHNGDKIIASCMTTETAEQIVADHNTVPKLVAALEDLVRQLPSDEGLADFNLDLVEQALAASREPYQ